MGGFARGERVDCQAEGIEYGFLDGLSGGKTPFARVCFGVRG